jgi:CheY-like chemotaxis protein
MNNNRRIMIVDDEPYNVLGLTIILQQSGYTNIHSIIDTAYSGKQALDLVISASEEGKESYGLIFMDCSMPIMDGYTASEKIKKFVKKNGIE